MSRKRGGFDSRWRGQTMMTESDLRAIDNLLRKLAKKHRDCCDAWRNKDHSHAGRIYKVDGKWLIEEVR